MRGAGDTVPGGRRGVRYVDPGQDFEPLDNEHITDLLELSIRESEEDDEDSPDMTKQPGTDEDPGLRVF